MKTAFVALGLGIMLLALALAEPMLRRAYVHRISAMSVPENPDERILTYPLA